MSGPRAWPPLPLEEWADTCATLHRWTQIVGKLRLASMPWLNHSWHVVLYVTPRGLTTGLVPGPGGGFEVEFDFREHRLRLDTADGFSGGFELGAMSVAAFWERTGDLLDRAGLGIPVWPQPVEIPGPVLPFPEDREHAAYDADAVERLHRVLLSTHGVLTDFRAGWIGKTSPVHFFWGAFDLALTRFSGRPAPPHPGGAPNLADWVMREAYSHEVASVGFWPGAGLGEPAFYAYAYPQPDGYAERPVRPSAAYWHEELREFVLPYEAVRTADDPDAALQAFLDSTWEAAAETGGWDRQALEADLPPRER